MHQKVFHLGQEPTVVIGKIADTKGPLTFKKEHRKVEACFSLA